MTSIAKKFLKHEVATRKMRLLLVLVLLTAAAGSHNLAAANEVAEAGVEVAHPSNAVLPAKPLTACQIAIADVQNGTNPNAWFIK